jgi:indole-3-glycerol phosphate synthase
VSILFDILEKRLSGRDETLPLTELRARIKDCEPARDFLASLRGKQKLSSIAEIKFRSPSKGQLRSDREVERIAASYSANGAAALSVITEERFFDGSIGFLNRARSTSLLPILRKDFHWDERDLLEARLHGADAVLLIAKMLDRGRLLDLRFMAQEFGLDVLLELHDENDLKLTQGISDVSWGVNHRNLDTLSIDLDVSARLFPLLPRGEIKVAESGIESREQLAEMKSRGANAVLVGTSLMRADDPGKALRELLS